MVQSIQNHFLDTNMIISIAFEDSNFNECKTYYKLEYKRYVSYNVKNETLNVIERRKIIALIYLVILEIICLQILLIYLT